MAHVTYIELVRQLTTDSDTIALLCGRISKSASRIRMFFPLLYVDYYVNRRVLKLLEQIETSGFGNSEKLCMDEVKQNLAKVRNGLVSMRKSSHHVGLPSLLLIMQDRTIERVDDKHENYWIGTDDEMEGLFASVSKKMNRGGESH
ncbi:MAG: hypothetical protein ACYC69_05190 [Thermodesulfovibrionales bacterium]